MQDSVFQYCYNTFSIDFQFHIYTVCIYSNLKQWRHM